MKENKPSILELQLFKKNQKPTERGELKQEYRPITAKWMSELMLYDGKHLGRKQWQYLISEKGLGIPHPAITMKKFDQNVMYLKRYNSANETRIVLKHKGIKIDLFNLRFIIKHGEIIQHPKPVQSRIGDGFVKVVNAFLERNPKITASHIADCVGYDKNSRFKDYLSGRKDLGLTDPIKDKVIDFMRSVELDIEVKIIDNKSE